MDVWTTTDNETSPKLLNNVTYNQARQTVIELHTRPACLWYRPGPRRCAGLESSSSRWTPWSCRCDVWSRTRSPCPPTGVPQEKDAERCESM